MDVSAFDAAALRRAREAQGLTQADLARMVGVAGGERVSRWELGRGRPGPAMTSALCQALNLEPADLMPEEALSLRGLRLRRGLTLTQLADQTGLNVHCIQQWERGLIDVPPDAIERLSHALGVATDTVTRSSTH